VIGAVNSRLFLIVLVALSCRLWVAGFEVPPPIGDGTHYDRIARSLLGGTGFGEASGYKTAHRAPGHPVALASAYALFGADDAVGLLYGIAIGTALVVLTALLAGRMAGPEAALIAGLVAALYPRLVDYAVRLWSLSENLFALLIVASLLLWAGARAGSTALAGAAGLGLGLAALTRPVALVLPIGLAIWGRMGDRRRVAVMIAVWLVTLTPWTVRNWLLLERFVPVSTMGGIVLYQGFHPPAAGWGSTPWEEIHRLTGDLDSEVDVSAALVRHTVATVIDEPVAAAAMLPRKIVGLLHPFSEGDGRIDPIYLVLLGAGAWSAWGARRRDAMRACTVVLLYIPATALVFYGSPRFRYPVEPVLIALASAGLVRLGERANGRRALAVLAVIVALVAAVPRPTAAEIRRWLAPAASVRPAGVIDAGGEPAGEPGGSGSTSP